jgi:hypothetical protein
MGNENAKCRTCAAARACRDTAVSWVFLFIGLIATLAVRLVNLVTVLGPFWPKFMWYVGVAGFFLYFLYKFRQDMRVRQELKRSGIAEKLSRRETLTEKDYALAHAVLCRLKSRKDIINYLVIFISSGIVLFLAVIQDFVKR